MSIDGQLYRLILVCVHEIICVVYLYKYTNNINLVATWGQ